MDVALGKVEWIRERLPVSEEDKAKAELVLEPWDKSGGLSGSLLLRLGITIPGNPDYNSMLGNASLCVYVLS